MLYRVVHDLSVVKGARARVYVMCVSSVLSWGVLRLTLSFSLRSVANIDGSAPPDERRKSSGLIGCRVGGGGGRRLRGAVVWRWYVGQTLMRQLIEAGVAV